MIDDLLNIIDNVEKNKSFELSLSHFQLTQLPSKIFELKNLNNLDLSWNELSSLPPEILELKNLTSLDLSHNKLSQLPPEIYELRNLTGLDLSNNKLSSLPSEIIKLKNLTSLDLSENQLSSLPPDILKPGLEIRYEYYLKPSRNSDFSKKMDKSGIYLRGNPLVNPPVGIQKKVGKQFLIILDLKLQNS